MPELPKIPNSIGISLINLDIREDLKKYSKEYLEFLKNNIIQYIKTGNTVYLYSFCKHEGDESTIDHVLEAFKDNPLVKDIRYDGDVDEFLSIYSKMEYMLCARFHAMILSCVARQKMLVMSYSKKIDNVVNDLELDLPILHFSDIKNDLRIGKEKFASVEEEKLLEIINCSKEQDRVFERKIREILK